MKDFLSILLLRGRLSRLPYGLVAVPILLAFQGNHFVAYHAPLVAAYFGADLKTFGAWLLPFFLLYDFLIIPLLIVSFNRLHDIGLTGFLAMPYLLKFALGFYAGWLKVSGAMIGTDTLQVLNYVSWGTYIYGLVLAFLLLLVPGRKAPVVCEIAPA